MIKKILSAMILMGLTWTSFGSVQAAIVNTPADLTLLDQLVNEHVLPKPEEQKLLLPSNKVEMPAATHDVKPATTKPAHQKNHVQAHHKSHKKTAVHHTAVPNKKPQTVVKKRHAKSKHLHSSAVRCRWSTNMPTLKK